MVLIEIREILIFREYQQVESEDLHDFPVIILEYGHSPCGLFFLLCYNLCCTRVMRPENGQCADKRCNSHGHRNQTQSEIQFPPLYLFQSQPADGHLHDRLFFIEHLFFGFHNLDCLFLMNTVRPATTAMPERTAMRRRLAILFEDSVSISAALLTTLSAAPGPAG